MGHYRAVFKNIRGSMGHYRAVRTLSIVIERIKIGKIGFKGIFFYRRIGCRRIKCYQMKNDTLKTI